MDYEGDNEENDALLMAEADGELDAESSGESDEPDYGFAQVGSEAADFTDILAQIESELDKQDAEQELLLAQIADYLASLDGGDIDAMETYMMQTGSKADGETLA